MLDAEIERQAHGRARRQRRRVHGIDTDLIVDVFLDAPDAAVVDIDGAEHVTGERASRIGTLQLVAERQARQTEIVDHLRDLRRHAAAHPDEAARPVGKSVAQFIRVEIRQHGGELLDQLVAVDHKRGIGKDRRGFEIGCEKPPVAIDDVGTAETRRHGLRKRQRHIRLVAERKSDELDRHLGKGDEQDGVNACLGHAACASLAQRITNSPDARADRHVQRPSALPRRSLSSDTSRPD